MATRASTILRFVARGRSAKPVQSVMQLGLQIKKHGDGFVLHCTGKIIRGAESEALDRMLFYLFNVSRRVVLDLRAVEMIDCGGLGILVAKFVEARQTARSLEFCAVSACVLSVFSVTGLENVFTIHQQDAAICNCALAEERKSA